jgi:TolA-binding protein
MVFMLGSVLVVAAQQGPQTPVLGTPGAPSARTSDLELAERLIVLRKNYQQTLEQLRFYYLQAGDQERAKMAEDELINWHRIRKHAFNENLDTPPPTLRGDVNIVDANNLLTRALLVKDHGYGTTYIDNQRRAEILLQELLTKYPQSNKISEAAYWLGEIYESKANEMYRRATWYYTRSYQWNDAASKDARLRVARLFDHKLHDQTKALEVYRDILANDHVPAHQEEARKRIAELSGKR